MRSVGLDILSTGWLTTYQDLGRHHVEKLGVPTGGAADQHSASVANILVGNRRDAPLLETMGGTLTLSPSADVLVAVTGAPTNATLDGTRITTWTPVVVPAGCTLSLCDLPLGSRAYVALQGELLAERFLGSVAPDARMGFGQVIPAGAPVELRTRFSGLAMGSFPVEYFRFATPRLPFDEGPWTIDVVRTGEGENCPGLQELLARSTYTVTEKSNHVGLRLDGPVLHPDVPEIVSHGVPIGALEVPYSEELIVLGRYRTLTAGYPIIGVATSTSLAPLGQAGPGRQLRFRWVDRREAVATTRARMETLDRLEKSVQASAVGSPPPDPALSPIAFPATKDPQRHTRSAIPHAAAAQGRTTGQQPSERRKR